MLCDEFLSIELERLQASMREASSRCGAWSALDRITGTCHLR
jgi:hypothetical protein